MPTKLPGLCVFISIAMCQVARAQQPTEEERVAAIVKNLMGPSKAREMPFPVSQRRISVERVDVVEKKEKDEFEEEEVRREVIPQSRGFASGSFDGWIFCDMAAEERQIWLDATLRRALVVCGVRHDLTDAELAKLHLAGTGDIKRLYNQIEVKSKEFDAVRMDFAKARMVLTKSTPIANKFMYGPFDSDSLLSKTLTKILDDRRKDPVR